MKRQQVLALVSALRGSNLQTQILPQTVAHSTGGTFMTTWPWRSRTFSLILCSCAFVMTFTAAITSQPAKESMNKCAPQQHAESYLAGATSSENELVLLRTTSWFLCFLVLHLRSPGKQAVVESHTTALVDGYSDPLPTASSQKHSYPCSLVLLASDVCVACFVKNCLGAA